MSKKNNQSVIPPKTRVKIIKPDALNIIRDMVGYDIVDLYGVITQADVGLWGNEEPLYSIKIDGTNDIVCMYGDELEEIHGC